MNGHEGVFAVEQTALADLSGKENPPPNPNDYDIHEKRKARDQMARLAMQREEAMETEEAR